MLETRCGSLHGKTGPEGTWEGESMGAASCQWLGPTQRRSPRSPKSRVVVKFSPTRDPTGRSVR